MLTKKDLLVIASSLPDDDSPVPMEFSYGDEVVDDVFARVEWRLSDQGDAIKLVVSLENGEDMNTECKECGGHFHEDDLEELTDAEEKQVRNDRNPPSGKCPDCGCLCYLR